MTGHFQLMPLSLPSSVKKEKQCLLRQAVTGINNILGISTRKRVTGRVRGHLNISHKVGSIYTVAHSMDEQYLDLELLFSLLLWVVLCITGNVVHNCAKCLLLWVEDMDIGLLWAAIETTGIQVTEELGTVLFFFIWCQCQMIPFSPITD